MAATAAGQTILDMASDYYLNYDWKAMLAGSGYTFDPDTHQFRSNVTSEVSGTGYVAGGITLTSTNVTIDTGTNRINLLADNADFGVITVTGATQIITYLDTGSAATDRIISVHTFAAQNPTAVNFAYAWQAGVVGYFSY